MDQLAALDRLIEGIDKDEWGDRKIPAFGRFLRFCADSGLQDHHIAAWDANEGCLNSVFALHNTLLPGWVFDVTNDSAFVMRQADTDCEQFVGESHIPSRAWLLALLRAYRAYSAILRAYRATIAQEATND